MKFKKLAGMLSLGFASTSFGSYEPPAHAAPNIPDTLESRLIVKSNGYYDNNNRREKEKYLENIMASTEKIMHEVVYELDYVFENGVTMSFELPKVTLGSGIVFKQNKEYSYIITNNHVIEREDLGLNLPFPRDAVLSLVTRKSERLYIKKGENEIPLEILATNKKIDAALLRIENGHGEFKRFSGRIGDSDKLRPGDFVYAVGSPYGVEDNLSSGMITKSEIKEFKDWFLMQAPINPGNSGGPVFAIHKGNYHLVGISVASVGSNYGDIFVPAQGMNLGVKINSIMKMVNKYFENNEL